MKHISDDTAALFVDGELSPSEEVSISQHVEQCSLCRDKVSELLAIRELFQSQVEPERSEEFVAAVMNRLDESSSNRWREVIADFVSDWGLQAAAAMCSLVLIVASNVGSESTRLTTTDGGEFVEEELLLVQSFEEQFALATILGVQEELS